MTTTTYGPYRGYTVGMLIHPGESLQEELEAREMTQASLAKALARPAGLVSAIVRGRRSITAETAVALEEALGLPAIFWLNLQSSYELGLSASRREGVAVE